MRRIFPIRDQTLPDMDRFLQSPKCLTLREMEKVARRERRKGKRMVLTNGCFDILHVGHVTYLEEARRLGDYLVVALNADASVRKLKGPSRPVNAERSRARVMAALQCVDFVVIFRTKRVTPVLHALRPEIYAKGGDYTHASLDAGERACIETYGGEIRILPLRKGYSTTNTLRKIQA